MPTKLDTARANELGGKDWMRWSISVWSDLRKTPLEKQLKHPANFPQSLVERLISCYCPPDGRVVCDPFAGIGTTLLAAQNTGKIGVGIELNPQYWQDAQNLLSQSQLTFDTFLDPQPATLFLGDARRFDAVLRSHNWDKPIDLIVTSPPYWDILRQKRSASGGDSQHYGDSSLDLGNESDYNVFVNMLADIFDPLYGRLRPGGYAVVNVMDLRKGPNFYMLHADVAQSFQTRGWILDDLIIWDRRADYNSLKPLGYPAVFRINRIHEYLLIFRKPKS